MSKKIHAADEPRNSIQVIARAANILRALEDEKDGLSLSQIAERVDLARSTVQRIVDALGAEQLVIAASPSVGVRLGPALIRLASSAQIGFDQITRPAIAELSRRLGETVDLSVLRGSVAVFTDQIQGAHRLRAVSAIGETFPLHCTANGKAILSLLPEEKVQRALKGPLTRHTPNTVTDVVILQAQIKSCKRSGVALDNEEYTEGISAVGTAFLDPLDRLVAISVPVPTARFKRIRAQVTEGLLATREEIVRVLGRAPA
jgi:DNA-binding IclR family transcriptional regulator